MAVLQPGFVYWDGFKYSLVPVPAGTPGPPGPNGGPGANGVNGLNAYTTVTSSFTQPDIGSGALAVTVPVGTTAWMTAGQIIYIQTGGYYVVSSIVDATDVAVVSLGANGDAVSGTTINAGSVITTATIPAEDAIIKGTNSNVTISQNNINVIVAMSSMTTTKTVTLPSQPIIGMRVTIKNVDNSHQTINVNANISQGIDGLTAYNLSYSSLTQYSCLVLEATSTTNWAIVSFYASSGGGG